MSDEVRRIASMVDLSVLGAATRVADVDEVIRVGASAGCATVCVNPCYVRYVAERLAEGPARVCATVGYPFGQNATEAKLADARRSVEDGAQELDMVANVGFFKDGRDREVADEIAQVVELAAERVVKVIIESCCLEKEELVRMARLVADAGAQFVKTSSGFNVRGGTLEEVRLLHEAVEGRAGVKISGLGAGLTLEQAQEFVVAGATRIGTRLACPMMDAIRQQLGVD